MVQNPPLATQTPAAQWFAPQNSPNAPSPLHRQVVAILHGFNEADILPFVLSHFLNQDIGVYFIDDASTDSTLQIAQSFQNKGLLGWESLHPSPTYDHRRFLARKLELFSQLNPTWCIHTDCDELRESPFPGLSYRQGLLRAQSEGYNAIDHVILHFHPTQDGFDGSQPLTSFFTHFHLVDQLANEQQVRTWMPPPNTPIDLATHAGHVASFPNRRIYPIPFFNFHYPLRSQAHGERKVYNERRPRFLKQNVQNGWHRQYDYIQSKDHTFLRTPGDLADPANPDSPRIELYDEIPFKQAYLARKYATCDAAIRQQLEEARRELAHLRHMHGMLRHKLADRLNDTLKKFGPLHKITRSFFK